MEDLRTLSTEQLEAYGFRVREDIDRLQNNLDIVRGEIARRHSLDEKIAREEKAKLQKQIPKDSGGVAGLHPIDGSAPGEKDPSNKPENEQPAPDPNEKKDA